MLVLLLIVSVGANGPTSMESARVRLSQTSLDYAEEVLNYMIDLMSKVAVTKLQLPEIRGSRYEVTGLKINTMELGRPEISILSGQGIQLRQPNAKIAITGDWGVKSFWWTRGTISVQASGIDITAKASVTVNSKGQPTTSPLGCSISFGSLDVDLDSSVFNWAVSWFTDTIEDLISEEVCHEVNSVLKTTVNVVIGNIPQQFKVGDLMNVNVKMDSDPAFKSTHIDMFLQAEGSPLSGSTTFPFSPVPMTDTAIPSKMMCLLLSDYSINTALYSGFTAGKINIVIPNKDTGALIPDNDPLFNTAGYKVSIPNLYTTYPDTNITFGIKNSGYPSIDFANGSAKVAIPVLVKIQPEGAATEAAVFSVAVTAEGYLKHSNSHISGKVTTFSHVTTVVSSNIGTIDHSAITQQMDTIIQNSIIPKVNGYFVKGITIPIDQYFTLIGDLVELKADYLKVCADLKLTQKSLDKLKKMAEDIVEKLG